MSKADIISFPKDKIVRQNTESIEQIKQKRLQNFADSFLEEILASFLISMENYGIEIEGPKFEKDFSFAFDSIRATIYRSLKINHPMHEFLDNHVHVRKKKKTKKENKTSGNKVDNKKKIPRANT